MAFFKLWNAKLSETKQEAFGFGFLCVQEDQQTEAKSATVQTEDMFHSFSLTIRSGPTLVASVILQQCFHAACADTQGNSVSVKCSKIIQFQTVFLCNRAAFLNKQATIIFQLSVESLRQNESKHLFHCYRCRNSRQHLFRHGHAHLKPEAHRQKHTQTHSSETTRSVLTAADDD